MDEGGTFFISAVFIISAVRLIRDRTDPPESDEAIRGAAVVYIVFVGLEFNTLLREADLGELLPWVNAIVHFAMPIAGLVDCDPPLPVLQPRRRGGCGGVALYCLVMLVGFYALALLVWWLGNLLGARRRRRPRMQRP